MTVALITHPDCVRHAMPGHPERPERLIRVMEQLRKSGIARETRQIEASEVTRSQLLATHDETLVTRIEQLEPLEGLAKLDQDTYMSPGSLRAAKLAAGACTDAVELVLAGEINRAFCVVRPPGHHAEFNTAMGFCLFNNIAVAAETALAHDGITRVAILDFDVHHGNGTVDIFKDREEVLVCSSFQYPFYPNRYLDFSNAHIVPTRLQAGDRGVAFKRAIERDWLPAIENHRPDIILVSAGFDAHKDDPLGELELTESDYRWVSRLIVQLANEYAKGRVVSTLEGGYDLDALGASVQAHVEELID